MESEEEEKEDEEKEEEKQEIMAKVYVLINFRSTKTKKVEA